MPFTKSTCEKCGKDAISEAQFQIGSSLVHRLKCGHLLKQDQLMTKSAETIVSLDGRRLFPFQVKGVEFVEKASGRALIGDEMGLGKTVQALALIALHPEMQPVVYVVKSGLKTQFQHEILRWASPSDSEDDMALAQVIEGSKDILLPGIKHYIFSFDILRRFNGSLHEQFIKRGVKTIIIDECQQIKNPQSERSKAVREICKDIPNVIALSGTPIKNNASEYFSILNILHPEMFPNYSQFLYNDCDSYYTGYGYKTGGLRDPEGFKRKTGNFIIRRTRKEVLPDLPTIDRRFQFHELNEQVTKAYQDTFKQFRDDYFSGGDDGFTEASNTLAYLSKMRHLTGLSKINPCIEFVEEFLESTDRKITLFVHHKDVAEILLRKLTGFCKDSGHCAPLSLTSDMDGEDRARCVEQFMSDPLAGAGQGPRILIASTLASGEGLNLQKCSDCVMVERQWNPANEEQAEGRFIRIGQTAEAVTATYLIATGTVDEFFSEIVERKREIVTKTLGGEAVKWDQSSLMKELAQTLAAVGGKKWGI